MVKKVVGFSFFVVVAVVATWVGVRASPAGDVNRTSIDDLMELGAARLDVEVLPVREGQTVGGSADRGGIESVVLTPLKGAVMGMNRCSRVQLSTRIVVSGAFKGHDLAGLGR